MDIIEDKGDTFSIGRDGDPACHVNNKLFLRHNQLYTLSFNLQ